MKNPKSVVCPICRRDKGQTCMEIGATHHFEELTLNGFHPAREQLAEAIGVSFTGANDKHSEWTVKAQGRLIEELRAQLANAVARAQEYYEKNTTLLEEAMYKSEYIDWLKLHTSCTPNTGPASKWGEHEGDLPQPMVPGHLRVVAEE